MNDAGAVKMKARLPGGVLALGFVSLFMDTSSELIHSLLPLFVVTGLGASATLYGVLEGAAEAVVLITKMFSGALSDRFAQRKPLALLGYGMAAASKPLFALATSVPTVFAARMIDRVGKGVRGAPRDALIADITPAELRGAAYGLRQSLDSVGALLGPLCAVGLMAWLAGDIPRVFWYATLPGVLSVGVLALFVREPASHERVVRKVAFSRAELERLGRRFALVTAVGAILTLARFSEGFLILRAADAGLSATSAPLVMVGMNLSYALSSYPVGALSDRVGRYGLLSIGAALLAIADLCLAVGGVWLLACGVLAWGLHMGFSQGLMSALIADAAPEDARGTAFGVFNLVSGVAMLLASVIAGAVWDRVGASATFIAGGGLAALAALALTRLRR